MEMNSISELIEDIRNGKMVVLVDDEDRENEGDLVLAADHVSPTAINFMAKEARGLVCLAMASEQVDKLGLPLMVRDEQNYSPNRTAFTVSIEAAYGVSTGISAADRAHTIKVAANPNAKPGDVHTPGHIFPIRAQQGGVLKRAGHTEGSVDLARLAGLNPAAVICEVMNDDGTMARVKDLKVFAKKHNLKIGTIVDLIQFRLRHESLVEEIFSSQLDEHFGKDYQLRIFRSKLDGHEHLALQKGEIQRDSPVLTRVQLDSYVRDFFSGLEFGSNSLLGSLRAIEAEGSGLLILLRGNNRSHILNECKALLGSEDGIGLPMDDRDFGIGAQILRAMGAQQIRLLTNKPDKKFAAKAFDIEIKEIVPIGVVKDEKEKTKESKNRRGHQQIQ